MRTHKEHVSLLSPLFVYSIIYLHLCRRVGIYFILRVIIYHSCYLLCFSDCSSFGRQKLFLVGSCVLLTPPHHALFFCPSFLTLLCLKMSGLILYISCPSAGLSHSSREKWLYFFIFLAMSLCIQDPSSPAQD